MWRDDPQLAPHIDPRHPDDLEATFVLVAHRTLERMWVRMGAPAKAGGVFIGYAATLLNTSHKDPGLAAGRQLIVRPSRSHPPLMWVPPVGVQNLRGWTSECEACGFDLLLIGVEQLAKMQFPDAPAGAVPVHFTTRCLMCQGTMMISARDA